MVETFYKKLIIGFYLLIFFNGCITDTDTSYEFNNIEIEKNKIEEFNKKVLKWQINNHPKSAWKNDWFNATLYHGITESARVFEDTLYWKITLEWAEHNNWEIGPRKFHADDQASATTYLNLYEYSERKNTFMLGDFKQAVDSMSQNYNEDELLWNWCDALYMAPVPIAKLGRITGEEKYYDLVNKHFSATYNRLYDGEYNLFYRDRRYLNERDKLGNPIFWSRGNGWVVAGLVGILKNFPENNDYYFYYRSLFKEIMNQIVDLQGEDGLWRTNLLNPSVYPTPETSGTSFFAYGLAWGMRQEILQEKKFGQALGNAWNGLKSHIGKDGKLRAVQSANKEPDKVDLTNSELFATGAFLLASSELYRFIQDKGGKVK